MIKIGNIDFTPQPDKDFNFNLCKKELLWKAKVEKKGKFYRTFAVRDKEKILLSDDFHYFESEFTYKHINGKSFIFVHQNPYLKSHFLYFSDMKWNKISCQKFKTHVTEKGLYYVENYRLMYMDFKNFESKNINNRYFGCTGKYFLHKKFMIVAYDRNIGPFFEVYVNPRELPKDIDLKLLNRSNIHYDNLEEGEFLVHFKDCSKCFSTLQLNQFKSNFIKDQAGECGEIYLDLNSEDFNIKNLQTLIYLNSGSGLIENLYKNQIMELFK